MQESITFSQVYITDRFDDGQRLGPDEWIPTTPSNATVGSPESMGLPSPGADADEVCRVASGLSALRESIPVPVELLGGGLSVMLAKHPINVSAVANDLNLCLVPEPSPGTRWQ